MYDVTTVAPRTFYNHSVQVKTYSLRPPLTDNLYAAWVAHAYYYYYFVLSITSFLSNGRLV